MTPLWGAAVVVGAAAAARGWRRWLGRQTPEPPAARLPRPPVPSVATAHLLDDLARRCRSGAALRTAIVEAEPTGDPTLDARLAEARDRLRAGEGLAAAASVFRVEPAAATAWSLALSGAAEPAAVLSGAATGLFERHALAREVRALTAAPRWSAVMIALLPLLFGLWAVVADPSSLGVLLGEPVGRVSLALGLALDLAGALWMRRLLRSVR